MEVLDEPLDPARGTARVLDRDLGRQRGECDDHLRLAGTSDRSAKELLELGVSFEEMSIFPNSTTCGARVPLPVVPVPVVSVPVTAGALASVAGPLAGASPPPSR